MGLPYLTATGRHLPYGITQCYLAATRHKWTRPALTSASKLVLNLPTPKGWKAELTWATWQCTGWESNPRSCDDKSDALTTTLPNYAHYRLIECATLSNVSYGGRIIGLTTASVGLLHCAKEPSELRFWIVTITWPFQTSHLNSLSKFCTTLHSLT